MAYHKNGYYLKAVQNPVQLQMVVYIFVCCSCFAAVVASLQGELYVHKKQNNKKTSTSVQTLSHWFLTALSHFCCCLRAEWHFSYLTC